LKKQDTHGEKKKLGSREAEKKKKKKKRRRKGMFEQD
jgi:hypothetical protein